jgi:hypothetical protein
LKVDDKTEERQMGILLNAVFLFLAIAGVIFSLFILIRNVKDKKRAEPVFRLSYSGEYTEKHFWTREMILIIVIIQCLGFFKLWMPVNGALFILIILLLFVFYSQLSRGVIGKNGILSAAHFYSWDTVQSVEWVTGLQADNPGYPKWGLVRFHVESKRVEFIIKKKVEDDVRKYVETQMALHYNKTGLADKS